MPAPLPDHKILLVRIPEAMKDALERRAKAEERTLAAVVRRIIRQYLETPEPTP